MGNPLTDVIPARYRKYLYAALFAAGLVVGALDLYGVNVGTWPSVVAYVGAGLGLVAASNTPNEES